MSNNLFFGPLFRRALPRHCEPGHNYPASRFAHTPPPFRSPNVQPTFPSIPTLIHACFLAPFLPPHRARSRMAGAAPLPSRPRALGRTNPHPPPHPPSPAARERPTRINRSSIPPSHPSSSAAHLQSVLLPPTYPSCKWLQQGPASPA